MEHIEAKPCRIPIDGDVDGAGKERAFLSAPTLLRPIVCIHRRIYMCGVP